MSLESLCTPEYKVSILYLSGIIGVLSFDLLLDNFSLTQAGIQYGIWQIQFGILAVSCIVIFTYISKKTLYYIAISVCIAVFFLQFLYKDSDDPFEDAARRLLMFIFCGGIAVVMIFLQGKSKMLFLQRKNKISYSFAWVRSETIQKKSNIYSLELRYIIYSLGASITGAILGGLLTALYLFGDYDAELFSITELIHILAIIHILISVPTVFPLAVVVCRIARSYRQCICWSALIGLATFGSVVLVEYFETVLGYQLLFLFGIASALVISVFRLGKTHVQLPPPPPDKPPQAQSEPANL
ncbi:MAG: hypothetical protein OXE04_04630 [bacterium]|nr:hypothetical protein [bacterium]